MKRILLLSSIILSIVNIKAQETKPRGYHKHDGFYLSMCLGPNFVDITNNVENDAIYKYSGTGTLFDLKIGGAIRENVILHGTLLSYDLTGPKIESNGQSQRASNKISIGEIMLGGGITYYLMPSNTFISASAGIGGFLLTNEKDDIDVSTDKGFAIQLKIGKEWWISKNWGFGIGITYGNSNVTNKPNQYITERLNSNNWGILFNTTFN